MLYTGNSYTYKPNEGSSNELDELKLDYLKQITHHASGGCYQVSNEYKIIYGNS